MQRQYDTLYLICSLVSFSGIGFQDSGWSWCLAFSKPDALPWCFAFSRYKYHSDNVWYSDKLHSSSSKRNIWGPHLQIPDTASSCSWEGNGKADYWRYCCFHGTLGNTLFHVYKYLNSMSHHSFHTPWQHFLLVFDQVSFRLFKCIYAALINVTCILFASDL